MRKADLQRYRKQLEALATRTRADAIALAEQALRGAGGQAGGDLSNTPTHLADMGTDEFMHDMNATLAENEEFLASEVLDALARIDNGGYGSCERCGKPIASERLDAIPYARLCIRCASEADDSAKVNFNRGRPKSPSDTLAPEGEMLEERRGGKLRERRPESGLKGEDRYAAGEAGGGASIGGLAGTNVEGGEPDIAALQDSAGSGDFDHVEARDSDDEPASGRGGGAGRPARTHRKPK
jgi:DnaK suppressor protein